MPGIQEQIHLFICSGNVSGVGWNHLTDLTCRVPRDDLCLISGLPTRSSSCSTGAKTKKIQRRLGGWGGGHETCAHSAAETQMGYLNSSLVLHGSREQIVPYSQMEGQQWGNIQYILTTVSLHQRKEATVSGFDVHTRGFWKWRIWLSTESCRAFTPPSLHSLMSSPNAFLHPHAQEQMARLARSQSH